MTEDEALAEYIAAGNAVRANPRFNWPLARTYWDAKIELFNARKANGLFPADTHCECRQSRSGLCCNDRNHRAGDVCLHCGIDFR